MAVLAIDQGTSATKAILWDGGVVAEAEVPVSGADYCGDAVEQDPEALLDSVIEAGRLAIGASPGIAVDAVAVGNQGETVLIWDRTTGKAVGPAVSWQDKRSAALVDALGEERRSRILAVTGLPIDPYFAAPKMAWLLAQHGPLREDQVVTTIDAFVLQRLTGEFVTDAATASRTGLLDANALQWSEEARGYFGIAEERLPEVLPCDAAIGTTDAFGPPMQVVGAIVDQQAALLAQGCVEPGMAKCTYGTGAFLLANIGAEHRPAASGLATSIAWAFADGSRASCLDGQVFSVGAGVSWLERVGLIHSPEDLDRLASLVADARGVQFRPTFAGRGAPFWDASATGTITGLTLGTEPAHIVRAFLEGIADEVAALAAAAASDIGRRLTALRVDGGLTRSHALMQMQADRLGLPVEVYPSADATALGIASLALRGLDGPASADRIIRDWTPARTYRPGGHG